VFAIIGIAYSTAPNAPGEFIGSEAHTLPPRVFL
jgi:hypothetical protein